MIESILVGDKFAFSTTLFMTWIASLSTVTLFKLRPKEPIGVLIPATSQTPPFLPESKVVAMVLIPRLPPLIINPFQALCLFLAEGADYSARRRGEEPCRLERRTRAEEPTGAPISKRQKAHEESSCA